MKGWIRVCYVLYWPALALLYVSSRGGQSLRCGMGRVSFWHMRQPAPLFPVTLSEPRALQKGGWTIAVLLPSGKRLCIVSTQRSLSLCQKKAGWIARAVNSYERLLSAVETLTKNQK